MTSSWSIEARRLARALARKKTLSDGPHRASPSHLRFIGAPIPTQASFRRPPDWLRGRRERCSSRASIEIQVAPKKWLGWANQRAPAAGKRASRRRNTMEACVMCKRSVQRADDLDQVPPLGWVRDLPLAMFRRVPTNRKRGQAIKIAVRGVGRTANRKR
jgi:hypothetical protein